MGRPAGPKIKIVCRCCQTTFELPPSKAATAVYCSRICSDEGRSFESEYTRLLMMMAKGRLDWSPPSCPDPQDRLRWSDGVWYERLASGWHRIVGKTFVRPERSVGYWQIQYEPVSDAGVPQHSPSGFER